MGLIRWLRNLATKSNWHLLTARSLALYKAGKYGEAIPIALQALQLAVQIWGPIHYQVATSLNNLAELYYSQDRYAEAEPLYLEAVAIDREVLPANHPSLATSLNRLANLYDSQDRYAEAEPLYLEAVAINRETRPANHPSLANHLNNLADLYYSQGRYAEAEPLLLEALAINREALPPNHLSLTIHLKNLADLYYSQGRYAEAEALYLEVVAIDKKALPANHQELATHLNNLALLYSSQGRYSEAELLYLEALAINRKALSVNHPDLVTNLNNLAMLYDFQGRYPEAEQLYLEAVAIDRETLRGNHPSLAKYLNNLASLYKSQGRYAEAEPLYLEAVAINREVLPANHPELANNLNNLALLYSSQCRYSEAEPLYLEALVINRKALPVNHPDLATNLNNLALLYSSQGRYLEAEPLYLEALVIDRETLRGNHPSLARDLNNLASLYNSQGRYAEAEPLYLEAVAINREALPANHPDLATYLNNLAGFLAATDRPQEALELMQEASEIENTNIQRYFGASSESDRLAYLQSIKTNFYGFLSLIYQYLPDSPKAKEAALNLVLKRKALTAAARAALNSAMFGTRYPHLQEQFQRWQQLNDKLLELSYEIPSPETAAALKQQLAQVQKECNDIERQLAREVPEMQLQELTIDRQAVASYLSGGASLLEFVRFRVYDFKAVPARGEKKWKEARYLAFLLPAGQGLQVEMVDLGEAAEIDRLISLYRDSVAEWPDDDDAPATPTPANLEFEAQKKSDDPPARPHLYNKAAGQDLRRQTFDKLRPALGGCRRLIFAADDSLNLVPWGILPLEEGDSILQDEFAIDYLNSGRELLRNSVNARREAGAAIAIAHPNYDLGGNSRQPAPNANSIGQLFGTLSGYKPFPAVADTAALAKKVGDRFQAEPWLGDDALAPRLVKARSPKMLLVATHGYFPKREEQQIRLFIDLLECDSGKETEILQRRRGLLDEEFLEYTQGRAKVAAEINKDIAAKLEAIILKIKQAMKLEPDNIARQHLKVEDPMMRCGLALAGANTWLLGGELPPEAGKGIIFAQDLAGIDLWATELVILVACESGLGDVKAGEGVFGLRRAFAVAGAKTLIMSLWKVPTYATILLMDRFFDNLENNMGRSAALKDAQNYLKNITARELGESELGKNVLCDKNYPPESKPLAHPYFWGAWICQGDN